MHGEQPECIDRRVNGLVRGSGCGLPRKYRHLKGNQMRRHFDATGCGGCIPNTPYAK